MGRAPGYSNTARNSLDLQAKYDTSLLSSQVWPPLHTYQYRIGALSKAQAESTTPYSFLLTSTDNLAKHYSAFTGATIRHEFAKTPLARTPKPWRLRQWPLQHLNSNLTLRFASTTPIPPPIAEVQSDYVPPPVEGEFLPTPIDELATSIPAPVYEHLGFLKEMGLDYGWGPTAFVETLLEHVHIYLGTPWWASIGISMLIIRVTLFKFYLNAADSSARRRAIKHIEDPISARIKTATAERDQMALREARNERYALHKSVGITWWKSMVPLVQIPIGFGTFRLMRGMASLPVPGFDNGGLLWVYDLTVPDPFYILPIATGWAYHVAFKVPSLLDEDRQTHRLIRF